MLLLLIQKVKRDILYRWMNLPPSAQKLTAPQRLAAHFDSTLHRLCSSLQYIGIVKFVKLAAETLLQLKEINLA